MAGAVMMIGGALVNALAFSGSNYLFSKLERSDSECHNKAMEHLTAARNEYEKNRMEALDFINEKLKEQNHAENTFTDVDAAIREYYNITGEDLTISEPQLSDFYKYPVNEPANEVMFIVGSMVLVYFFARKFKQTRRRNE